MGALEISIDRIYDPPRPEQGARVLVDRLWPRGIRKTDAGLDYWEKDLTPSTDLRTRLHSGAVSTEEFADDYRAELASSDAPERFIRQLRADGVHHITLITSAKPPMPHVRVLAQTLSEIDARLTASGPGSS